MSQTIRTAVFPVAGRGTRIAVRARIRHAGARAAATVFVRADGGLEVRFRGPVFAPAPGQALVAYLDDGAVLCGGTIARGPAGGAEASRG